MTQLCTKQEIFIEASPEAVWRVHTDINAWGAWQPGIASASLSSPLAVGAVFKWKTGGLVLTSTIESVEAGRHITWVGEAMGTRAHHAWTLRSRDGGTVVATEESMSGWLVRVLRVFSPHFLDRSLDTWLQSLKARAEAGVETTEMPKAHDERPPVVRRKTK